MSEIIEGIKKRFEAINEKFFSFSNKNKLTKIFSQHPQGIEVCKGIEIEYSLYHELKNIEEDILNRLSDISKELMKDLGLHFNIIFGPFVEDNYVNNTIKICENYKYDPSNYDYNYFYIQINPKLFSNRINDGKNIYRKIKLSIIEVSLKYLDYLYGNSNEVDEMILSNILCLYLEDVNNLSYFSNYREELLISLRNKEFGYEASAAYFLIKTNVENMGLKRAFRDDYIKKESRRLFCSLLSCCTNRAILYHELIADINKAIVKKNIRDMIFTNEENNYDITF